MKSIQTLWCRWAKAFQELKPKDQRDILCLFLALLVVVVYSPVIRFDFLNYDDPGYLHENLFVKQGVSTEGLWWALTSLHANISYWHPLTWISHQLDFELFGSHPGAHHLTNVVIHAANAILVFLIARRITARIAPGFLVALFFAIHPLRVESVAWIAERKDVLCAFFYFAAIWLYLGYATRPRLRSYLAVLFAGLLALMSKPMAVTLPCVLILLDFWPLRRFSAEPRVSPVPAGMNSSVGPSPRPRFEWPGCLRRWFGFSPCASFLGVVLEKLPFFGLAALTSFLAVKAQQDLGALMSQTTLPLVERIANALVAYAAYLDKTVLPMNLSVHYNHPYVHPLWRIAIACLALAILSALAVRIRRNHPIVLFGWLWFLGVLIPSIGLVQAGSQSMADRYTYIPSFGLLLMLVPLLEIKSPQALRRMRIGTGGVALSAVALILAAEHQLQYWRNTQSLFERAIQVDPHDFIAHTNLGITYKRQGKFALAIASLQLAMIGNPTTGLPKLAMADLLARQGKPLASLPFYFSALHGRDNMRHFAHSELAFIFCQLGRVEEGIPHLYEALRIRPGFQTATALLAEIYAREKDPRFRDGRKAVALAHELCEATYGIVPEYLGLLAAAYAECGQFDKAVEGAQRAIVRAAISGKDRLKHHLEQELKLYREHKKPLHVLEQGRATDLTESANSGPPPGNTE